MFADRTDPRERATTLALVAAIHVALGYALLSGLAVDLPRQMSESLHVFSVLPPPPPPKPPAPKPREASHRAPRKEGAASPPNLQAKATPIVVPKPVVILPPPPPLVIAAPKAGEGAADHAGAAPVPGPGSGSGGIGNGTGSGDSGDGPGGGGRGGKGRRYEYVSGRIKNSDYPRGAFDDDREHVVGIHFVIGVRGRVTDCTITQSSGSPLLDATTCDLIKRRLRFRPTLDARGKPIPDYQDGTHTWYAFDGPDDERVQDDR